MPKTMDEVQGLARYAVAYRFESDARRAPDSVTFLKIPADTPQASIRSALAEALAKSFDMGLTPDQFLIVEAVRA